MNHKTGNKILDIRLQVAIDFETQNYYKLSETYKKKFSIQQWIDTQVFGRLFLTGTKHNYVWGKFWQEFYEQCYSIAYSVVKDRDTADIVVCNQFDAFRNRKKYGNSELYDMKKNLKSKIEKISKTFEESEIIILKADISILKSHISDLEDKLINLYFEELEYTNKTPEEIYQLELNRLVSQDTILPDGHENPNGWFKPSEPVAGYILMAIRHTAMMEHNKINGNKIINISKIITHSSNKSMSDGDLTDLIAEVKSDVDEIYEIYNNNIAEFNMKSEEDSIHYEHDMIPRKKLKRAKELYELSKNPDILIDFFFNNLTHNQLYKKYGFNTSGAVKSIVSRANRFVVSIICNEIETEKIANKEQDNGTIRFYYPNTYGCLKESCEIKNKQRHGENVLYFENGNIKKKQSWENGKLVGNYIEYYENKKVKQKGSYNNGEKVGEWCDYGESGKLDESRTYGEDDCYSYVIYDEFGKVEEKGHINGFGEQIIDFSKSIY